MAKEEIKELSKELQEHIKAHEAIAEYNRKKDAATTKKEQPNL